MMMPPKDELMRTLRDAASTLSEEMLRAAIKKAGELGFDLTQGQLAVDETLINLRANRDLIIDAIDKQQLQRLPLKFQYELLHKTQRISEALTNLVNGTDAISVLGDSVDDLNAMTWQYHLHHQSDVVLGYERKMNQLKAQEVLLQQASARAQAFLENSSRTQQRVRDLDEIKKAADGHLSDLVALRDKANSATEDCATLDQRATAILATLERYDGMAAQHAADANIASANVASIADNLGVLQATLEAARNTLSDLTEQTTALISGTTTRTTVALDTVQSKVTEFDQQTSDTIKGLRAEVETHTRNSDTAMADFLANATRRLAEDRNGFENTLASRITSFRQLTDTTVGEITSRAAGVIASHEADTQKLIAELAALEERIRTAIERATGFTLFQAFQRRQLDLGKSKRFWAYALAVAVGVSLVASTFFLMYLPANITYTAGFFLKLSVSLPLIYAIAFCGVQYGRERRLEEEYAFKSAISISLEPYQKLVEQLVKDRDDERPKYTAFVIESIARVFSSPTDSVFDGPTPDKNTAEKTIKAAGDLLEPILKIIKR